MNSIDTLKSKIGAQSLSILYSVFGGLVLIAFWLYISQVKPVDKPPTINTSIIREIAYVDDEENESTQVEIDDDYNERGRNRPQQTINLAKSQTTTSPAPSASAVPANPSPQQPATTPTQPTPGSYKDGTYSATSPTPWGNLTVSVTVTNGKWSKVDSVQTPDSPPSIYAVSRLAQQALNAQTQNINGISGATYVSNAFRDDLSQIIQQSKN